MNVAVLGATGFVGRALVLALLRRGHAVSALVRSPASAARVLPDGVAIAHFGDDEALARVIGRADGVINLAGEPIAGPRWTDRRKQVLVESRLASTARLAKAIAARAQRLAVFVSASASGYYGDRGDEILVESSPPGEGFAPNLCERWEQATAPAAARAARIVHPRIGIVLGLEGGMLGALRPLYGLGLGGPIAGGDAWLPWIHLEDLVRALVHLLESDRLDGPVNLVAPAPVRQHDFAHAYGHILHRPAIVPAPAFALRAMLGEQVSILTASQRLDCEALRRSGFTFRFPTLDAALADLVDDNRQGITIEPIDPADTPWTDYLRTRPARFVLTATTRLAAPLDEVFAFFSAPKNLAAITPPNLAFEMTTEPEPTFGGQLIDYRIRVLGAPLRWRTKIDAWEPMHRFVDSQLRGPYRSWWHEHTFAADGAATTMRDRVYFTPPLAFASEPLVVAPMLRRIFTYRRHAIRFRFGD